MKIDETISWNKQTDNICKKKVFIISRFSRLKHIIPSHMLMLICSSVMQPKFDFAITIWGYTCDNNLHKIQRLQNRAARIVTGHYDYVTTRGTELVKRLKWMCVTQRRDYFMSILMYKSIHGMAPAYLCNEITLHSENADFFNYYFLLHNSTLYCTGQHCKRVIVSACSTLFKYS